jgi:hypothetical protein
MVRGSIRLKHKTSGQVQIVVQMLNQFYALFMMASITKFFLIICIVKQCSLFEPSISLNTLLKIWHGLKGPSVYVNIVQGLRIKHRTYGVRCFKDQAKTVDPTGRRHGPTFVNISSNVKLLTKTILSHAEGSHCGFD